MKQYELEKKMDLEQALQLHYLIGKRIFERSHNMSEGVRTVLIDKDEEPKWKPKTIKGEFDVDFFFTEREDEARLNFNK